MLPFGLSSIIMQEIKIGQTWQSKANDKISIKILGRGYRKYSHKVLHKVSGLIEKEDSLDDGVIVIEYNLIDLKDKLDMILGEEDVKSGTEISKEQ